MITPKYKVGQKIRITKPTDENTFPEWHGVYEGLISTISKAIIYQHHGKDIPVYRIKINSSDYLWFNEKCITPIPLNYQTIKRLSKN